MKKGLLIGLLLLLCLAGYLYYRHLTTTPQYALAQAAKATQTHDVAAFERYVNVESVTSNLVDQVASQASALGLEDAGVGSVFMKGALQMLKPQLVTAARNEVRRYVEDGTIGGQSAGGTVPLMNAPLAAVAGTIGGQGSALKGIKYVRTQGQHAQVGIEFTQPKYDTTLVVELQLTDQGNRWQVTGINNAGELLERVVKLEKRKLRPRG